MLNSGYLLVSGISTDNPSVVLKFQEKNYWRKSLGLSFINSR
jgi:hypothetical protein